MHNVATKASQSILGDFKAWKAREDLTIDTAISLLSSIKTTRSLTLLLLIQYEEWDQVVTMDVDPVLYLDHEVDRFYDDYICTSLLKKAKFLRTSFDKKGVAIAAFKAAEQQCKRINGEILIHHFPKNYREDSLVISTQLRKIERILGFFDIDEVIAQAAWGPGVTQSVKGEDVSSARKFDVESEITRDAYALFGEVMKAAYPSWDVWKTEPSFKTGNQIITVPKNAKTDRTIAIEPGLNVWIQLGIGKVLRRRLARAGFNLNSDLKNHRMAYIGSVNDSVATVDFKAASDTISRRLVEFLIPNWWYIPLDAARSHFYNLDGNVVLSEKFSTMGNGFTFELESLIFVTLALAICEVYGLDESLVSIFGDDLTLPSEAVPILTRICDSYGFTVNAEKTFSEGPFRESCGSYYFNGASVKPLFFKEALRGTKSVYRTLNSIRNLAHNRNFNYGCDIRFRSCYNRLLNALPKRLRFFGPADGGDAVIHCSLDEMTDVRRSCGWDGFFYSGFATQALETTKDSHGLLLARLWRIGGDISYGNKVPYRARTKIVLSKRMFCKLWYDFGAWN